MLGLNRLSIKMKLAALAGVFVIGFLVFGYMGYDALNSCKNNTNYQRVGQDKDLIADILPPPAYIIETYLVTNLLAHETDESKLHEHVEKLQALKKDYFDRQLVWQKDLPEGAMKDK